MHAVPGNDDAVGKPTAGLRTRALISALFVAGVALAAIAALRYGRDQPADARPRPFQVGRMSRLTTDGQAKLASISDDGRYVAHIRSAGDHQSLWVRQTATNSDIQIQPPAAVQYDGISFSPDGNHVYYVTRSGTWPRYIACPCSAERRNASCTTLTAVWRSHQTARVSPFCTPRCFEGREQIASHDGERRGERRSCDRHAP